MNRLHVFTRETSNHIIYALFPIKNGYNCTEEGAKEIFPNGSLLIVDKVIKEK